MGNATSIADQPTGISPEAFEALRNEYEVQKKAEPVLTGVYHVVTSAYYAHLIWESNVYF